MDHDSTDHPKPPRKARRGSQPDLPPQDLIAADVDPATSAAEEDDEARLPEAPEESAEAVAEGTLAVGHAAIENAVRLAPTSPGVYRMLNAGSDVLYVGKAKIVRKRLSSYARVNAPLPARILRMIAATVTVEIISTTTETEALLLEANLIKQLRPRFNVQLRDDKSFPYILISGDHCAPQILRHRGRRSSRSRASIRARWKKPTCSPSIRRAAIPASKCSSSAPARTGATAPISPRPRSRSRRRKCWPRSSRNSTTTSRRRDSSCCHMRSRKARCWPMRSRSRPASRWKSRRRSAAKRKS